MSAAIEKTMARILAALALGPAAIEETTKPGRVLLRGRNGAICVEATMLRALADGGVIVRGTGTVCLSDSGSAAFARLRTREGNFGDQHREIVMMPVDSGSGPSPTPTNLAESPIAQLVRRKGKDGRPFLTAFEFDAGERLRGDYTRGMIMPRLGANWEASVASGPRGSENGIADLTDAALAARLRVERALKAIGPELSGLLVDVCCFLKGLETVERERLWPVRSAKILLKTALGMLARHYHPAPAQPAQPHVLHWGSQDYRPSLG